MTPKSQPTASPELPSHRTRRAANRVPRKAALDGRSTEWRLLLRTQAELIAAIGGDPTPLQQTWIDQAAWAKVRLYQLNMSIQAGKPLGKLGTRQHVGLSNVLTVALGKLEPHMRTAAAPPAKAPGPTLRDLLDQRRADSAP